MSLTQLIWAEGKRLWKGKRPWGRNEDKLTMIIRQLICDVEQIETEHLAGGTHLRLDRDGPFLEFDCHFRLLGNLDQRSPQASTCWVTQHVNFTCRQHFANEMIERGNI